MWATSVLDAMCGAMTPPLAIRHVTDEARAALEAGRRRHDACRVRRCQMV
jgi:hypothetical protein